MCGYLRPDHLERHPIALKQTIFHLVNLTHAAARDKAHHEKAVRDGVSGAEARCHVLSMITIKVGDGCTTSSRVLPAPDNRPAQEAPGAFVFPQQFLNQPSQRGVPAARAVDKNLPL